MDVLLPLIFFGLIFGLPGYKLLTNPDKAATIARKISGWTLIGLYAFTVVGVFAGGIGG